MSKASALRVKDMVCDRTLFLNTVDVYVSRRTPGISGRAALLLEHDGQRVRAPLHAVVRHRRPLAEAATINQLVPRESYDVKQLSADVQLKPPVPGHFLAGSGDNFIPGLTLQIRERRF